MPSAQRLTKNQRVQRTAPKANKAKSWPCQKPESLPAVERSWKNVCVRTNATGKRKRAEKFLSHRMGTTHAPFTRRGDRKARTFGARRLADDFFRLTRAACLAGRDFRAK